ncbi:MAG: hypothetical protein COT90_02215 [Candidatus Diapherotrites archaeon CG10_big_fil_rev_8_21_14_0_10_31_34]|nr:MAG: hypothetical protein COT90_02215 [Candidatus Diapherotrites archaeon CG10_big_fil_rev_8_21_14_0_10_31_34]PJA21213.1 MAG: hypothetical protein COX63_00310 [Candidatus Diapherotrites archaeon CG_4_10_14_0_2_um_filter_31_5]
MRKKFYLDTCIWRDYFEDRKDNLKPLGEFAFQFLKKCEKNNWKVLYSEFVVKELKKDYSEERIKEIFSSFQNLLVKVHISIEQIIESEKLKSKIKESHESDILHAIISRDNNAVLISRDRHFDYLKDFVEVKIPEEIIFD